VRCIYSYKHTIVVVGTTVCKADNIRVACRSGRRRKNCIRSNVLHVVFAGDVVFDDHISREFIMVASKVLTN